MKIRSILLIILLSLIFIYAVAHLVAVKKLETFIEQEASITVENTSLNLLMGNLSLEGATLTDDRYTTETCTIKSIQVKGFSVIDYLFDDQINIDNILLQEGKLFLRKQTKADSSKQSKQIFYISNNKIDRVDLNYGSEKFSLQASNGSANISSLTNADKLQYKDLLVSFKDMTYNPKNGIYKLLTKKIELNSAEGQFSADNFTLQPKCSVDKWPECYPDKKARSRYSANNIVGKLDPKTMFSGVFLQELEIGNGMFELISYEEMEPSDSPKAFFMKQFDKLNIPINIPVMKVKDHTIRILLKGEFIDKHVDTISFNQLYSTITNITNLPDKLKVNNSINVVTLSNFMDSKLVVDFDFKIKDPLSAYNFNLSLAPMPFTKLNRALNFNTPLVVEEGKLHQLDCEVSGNTLISNSKCSIAYEELYVRLEDKRRDKKKFISRLLNLVVKDGTRKSGSLEPKVFESTLERDENKDFFFQTYTIILETIADAILPI